MRDSSSVELEAYLGAVIMAVRIGRVLLIMALAFMTLSLVMGIGTSTTGPLEKLALLFLIGGCVFVAAKLTTLSERIVHRLETLP